MQSSASPAVAKLSGSFVQNCGPFYKIVDKFVAFSNKIVNLFGKIVDLLFKRGVLPHLENSPGYGPARSVSKVPCSKKHQQQPEIKLGTSQLASRSSNYKGTPGSVTQMPCTHTRTHT